MTFAGRVFLFKKEEDVKTVVAQQSNSSSYHSRSRLQLASYATAVWALDDELDLDMVRRRTQFRYKCDGRGVCASGFQARSRDQEEGGGAGPSS